MRSGKHRIALASAAAALLFLLSVTAPVAHGADGETEVRIAARRLADGRTEAALQQRQPYGAWARRLLRAARFVP